MVSKSNSSFDSFEKASWRDLPGAHKAALIAMIFVMLLQMLLHLIFKEPYVLLVFLSLSLVVLFIIAWNIAFGNWHSAFLVLAIWLAVGGFVLFTVQPFSALVTNFPWP